MNDRVTPSIKRACGDCTLCCEVMAIEALAKPAGRWCRHCQPGRGCAIYAERPAECGDFACLWLVNDLLDERWKPSRSKLVLTTSDDGIEVRCDPGTVENDSLRTSVTRLKLKNPGLQLIQRWR